MEKYIPVFKQDKKQTSYTIGFVDFCYFSNIIKKVHQNTGKNNTAFSNKALVYASHLNTLAYFIFTALHRRYC